MSKDALLIIDMQQASVAGNDKHDVHAVIARINALATRVRARGGRVVFVLHDGTEAEALVPHTPGWEVVHTLDVSLDDVRVRKTLNDPFAGTTLRALLDEIGAERVIVTGWATDFCVDATVRSAVSQGLSVAVASDAHTLNDRPHLRAEQVIAHHNWVWENLLSATPVQVMPAAQL